MVHHNLWDYDIGSQPVLFEFERDGQKIPALAQATKMGHLFLLNRETGEPLYPVEERPVPASDVPGELASPTQPFPTWPPPMVPQGITPDDAFGGAAAFDEATLKTIASETGGRYVFVASADELGNDRASRRDDHIAHLRTALQIAVRLGRLLQGEAPVDDRLQASRLDQLPEGDQAFRRFGGRLDDDPLAARPRSP